MLWFLKAENWPGILPYRRQAKDWWAWKPASPFIHLAPGILNFSLPTAAVILLLLKLLWRADAIPGSLHTHCYTIAVTVTTLLHCYSLLHTLLHTHCYTITVTITRTIGVLRLRWQECSYHRRTMAGAERKEATTESLDTCRSRNSPILTFTFVDFYFGNVNASLSSTCECECHVLGASHQMQEPVTSKWENQRNPTQIFLSCNCGKLA